MAQDESIASTYAANESRYRSLAGELEFALRAVVEATGVRTHSITSRVKTLADVEEKTARKGYERPFEQMHDIVGARVVVLFLDDLPVVREAIRDAFEIRAEDDRIEDSNVAEFGYLGIHFDAQLAETAYAGPRYDRLHDLTFEVQLRTIAMDAWAVLSHYLGYKGPRSIPKELLRDFYALSGLFYVADQHFAMFYNQAEDQRERANRTFAGRLPDALSEREATIDLNADTLRALLISLYGDRTPPTREDASELLEEIAPFDYTTRTLEAALVTVREKLTRYEDEIHNPSFGIERRLVAVGAARISLALANEDYRVTRYQDEMADTLEKYAQD